MFRRLEILSSFWLFLKLYCLWMVCVYFGVNVFYNRLYRSSFLCWILNLLRFNRNYDRVNIWSKISTSVSLWFRSLLIINIFDWKQNSVLKVCLIWSKIRRKNHLLIIHSVSNLEMYIVVQKFCGKFYIKSNDEIAYKNIMNWCNILYNNHPFSNK